MGRNNKEFIKLWGFLLQKMAENVLFSVIWNILEVGY